MRHILITGGTGLVGRELAALYADNGEQVTILTRTNRSSDHKHITYLNWQEDDWESAMPNKIDIVINLAGASLSERWTKEHKEAMLQSRIETTERLYAYFQTRDYQPDILFNASAIGLLPTFQVCGIR